MGENPKKKKNEKELGLVVSQQTVIRNQAELSSLKKRGNSEKKNEKEFGLVVSQQTLIRNQAELSEKGKKQKRIRPNGPKIRNLQVEISLSPNFGASLPLIDPISPPSRPVTSKISVSAFQKSHLMASSFSGFKFFGEKR